MTVAACERATMAKATHEVAAVIALRAATNAQVRIQAALHALKEKCVAATALERVAYVTRERVSPSCSDDAGWIINGGGDHDARPYHGSSTDMPPSASTHRKTNSPAGAAIAAQPAPDAMVALLHRRWPGVLASSQLPCPSAGILGGTQWL